MGGPREVCAPGVARRAASDDVDAVLGVLAEGQASAPYNCCPTAFIEAVVVSTPTAAGGVARQLLDHGCRCR